LRRNSFPDHLLHPHTAAALFHGRLAAFINFLAALQQKIIEIFSKQDMPNHSAKKWGFICIF
jgi:hypothetical protein